MSFSAENIRTGCNNSRSNNNTTNLLFVTRRNAVRVTIRAPYANKEATAADHTSDILSYSPSYITDHVAVSDYVRQFALKRAIDHSLVTQ